MGLLLGPRPASRAAAGLLRRVWAALLPLALGGLLTLAAGGCTASRSVVAVDLPAHSLVPPAGGDRLTSPDEAVRAISAVMARELGLPVPERVTVYLYSGREVFEQGLIRDANIAPVRAAELSDFAVGVGKRRQLLLHDEPGMDRGPEWLRLIAHEMTHVAQIELARGEGRAEQWLAEGMAEWVAFTVLERLQLDAVSRRHDVAVTGVRAQAALQAGRLDLQTLGTPRGFTMRHLREGSLPTYQLSFLMAEYLIHREGLPRVVEYFEATAHSRDRRATFQGVFGQSLDQFEREVLQYLQLLVLAAEAEEARSRGGEARPQ